MDISISGSSTDNRNSSNEEQLYKDSHKSGQKSKSVLRGAKSSTPIVSVNLIRTSITKAGDMDPAPADGPDPNNELVFNVS